MYKPQEAPVYDEIMAKISDYLEYIILDAMLSVFQKMIERNSQPDVFNNEDAFDEIPF